MGFKKKWAGYAVLGFVMVSLAGLPAMGGAANTILGNLPGIHAKYQGQLEVLFQEYKKAKTKEEKQAAKDQKSDIFKAYKAEIESYNGTTPLAGKKLPVKTSGELPFSVQNAEFLSVSTDTLKFSVTVRFNQDMIDDAGQILERESVYFCAVDKKGGLIKNTWNYATNSDWIKLTRGTVYEVQGHWKANRVMHMADFDHLLIVPKSEYKKK